MKFDCIIPVAGKDCLLLRNWLILIRKNISPEKIYIITKAPFFNYFSHLDIEFQDQVILIDEDELLKNIDFETISIYLKKKGLGRETVGWYYQQFLKMGFALTKYAEKCYLTWDSDTYPVRKIVFFDENGLPYFSMKDEYHNPYFVTIENLLNLKKATNQSFISENMLIDVQIMRSLISEIEQSGALGENWCEKIINAMPMNENNAFSEFETYGTYVLNHFPEAYKMRSLNTFRRAGKKYSRFMSPFKLEKKSTDYDMVTLENRNNPNNLIGLFSRIHKKILIYKNKKMVLSYTNSKIGK